MTDRYFRLPHPFEVKTNVARAYNAPKYIKTYVPYAKESWQNAFGGSKVFNLVDENGCCVSPKRHLETKNIYRQMYDAYKKEKLKEIPCPF